MKMEEFVNPDIVKYFNLEGLNQWEAFGKLSSILDSWKKEDDADRDWTIESRLDYYVATVHQVAYTDRDELVVNHKKRAGKTPVEAIGELLFTLPGELDL